MLDTSREATAFFFAWAGLYTKRVRQKKHSLRKKWALSCAPFVYFAFWVAAAMIFARLLCSAEKAKASNCFLAATVLRKT